MRTIFRVLIVVAVVLVVVLVYLAFRMFYPYKTYPESKEIFDKMTKEKRDYFLYGDKGVGFVIFIGVKTKKSAYAYLAEQLHKRGYTVLIPSQTVLMSAHEANHTLSVMKQHTEVQKWILIGHALGGRQVTRLACMAPNMLIGIVFLATFASVDLSRMPFPALRITAGRDGIMDNQKMDSYENNLPADSETIRMKGANHRGFGAYSSKDESDGTAMISWKQQNEQTANLILSFYARKISAVVKENKGK